MEVSSLWIGNQLPKLSILCINSFLKLNYKFNLYIYEPVENVPNGVTLKNAEDILPQSEIFNYTNGSVSAFSNLFRFTMMQKTGIPWVDTDIFCHKVYDFSKDYIIITSEPDKIYTNEKPTSNILKFPQDSEYLKRAINICYEYKPKILSGEFKWGLGPLTIKMITQEFKLEKYIKPWQFSNNCNNHHYQILYQPKQFKKFSNFPIFSLKNPPPINHFIHLWNEHFRFNNTSCTSMFTGDNMLTQMWNVSCPYPIPTKHKRILITGASGLVGSALIPKLQNFPVYTPRSNQLNLLKYNELNNYLKENKINTIIHLAANVGGLFKNMNHKVEMLEDNLLMNFNVIKAAHQNKISKLISCLSTCIFPDDIQYPISEASLHNGPPHFSNDAYAYAKRMADIQSRAYKEQYNDNFISIIPTNIYGPKDNYNLENAHVIPALIHKCFLARKEKKKFIVKGSGKPLRQFIYSEDLAELIKWVYLYYDDINPIILAKEEEYSIGDIARLIAKEFNYESHMEFDTSAADGQFKKTADTTKLQKFLKDHNINMKWTSLEDGIKKSVNSFIDLYSKGEARI